MASSFNKLSQLREKYYQVQETYCTKCRQFHSQIKGCVTSIIVTEMVQLNQELFPEYY